ncbi:MAG: MBL fold metallo-hydrolase, partial [Gammaproteobacteria bacterium]|nr:MBL fold metallo-hydrolase [Gammaproteobacteria bacterium]
LTLLLSGLIAAQEFDHGYIDPAPILAAASAAIGEERLSCISIAGSAYTGMVGQQYINAYEVDWPRGEPLRNYTRVIDFDNVRMLETFDREPGNNPASWKYGLGWYGGTPIQQEERQIFSLNGQYAWHQDGANGIPVAARPLDAERWQLDMWLTPHGFLKAARLPGANPVATWRWELGEMGRDGATVDPERVSIVSITIMGKYRVDATINSENLLQRIHTWVPDSVIGDTNYEHEFSNADYIDLGDGIRFPTVWHHHTGWDDNYQAQSINAGHNAFGGRQADIIANECPGEVPIPNSVRAADFSENVVVEALADGIYLFGGGSHNSVVVEFDDYIAVVEAPLYESRNLAVIDEIAERIPDKPIRFVVNTHQHHDHVGGLRTYMHIGATIITHWKNYDFYTNDVLNYAQRTLDPDMVSLWPPTELAEGYQYETVRENYVLTDGDRIMQMSYVHPSPHVEGMLVAYLPAEKILVEADLFDAISNDLPAEPSPGNRTLYNHVQRLGLDVETIVPIHGQPTAWTDFADLFD